MLIELIHLALIFTDIVVTVYLIFVLIDIFEKR